MSVLTDPSPDLHLDAPPLASIDARVATVCGVLNVAHAQLVDLIAEVLVDDRWHGVGIRSAEHWVAWRTGLSAERARQLVALARRRNELPVSFAAFSDGELSVDQISVIARHSPTHNDQEICDVARFATVAQLRSLLGKYPFPEPTSSDDRPTVASPAPSEVERPDGGASPASASQSSNSAGNATPRPASTVWFGWGDNGRFTMHVDCDALAGSLIEQAMLEARDALFHTGRPDVRWIDALTEICGRSLDAVTSPARRDRYRIYVHLDTNGAWLQQGPALRRDLVEQLWCDAAVVPIWETDGVPVRVGRTRRSPSRHVRRLVLDRDRICRHPACSASHHLEVHHVDHWSGPAGTTGGSTDPERLAALCPAHHDAHHRGEFTITGDADRFGGLEFRLPTGALIEPNGRPRSPDPSAALPGPPTGHEYRHPTGERLESRWVFFSDPSPPGTADVGEHSSSRASVGDQSAHDRAQSVPSASADPHRRPRPDGRPSADQSESLDSDESHGSRESLDGEGSPDSRESDGGPDSPDSAPRVVDDTNEPEGGRPKAA